MYVRLSRYYRSLVQCRGFLTVFDGGEPVFECKTLELPWKGNQNRISCIPPGPNQKNGLVYDLHPRSAEESGSFTVDHFIVKGVKGRSYILIHPGNLYTQILGCILVGREWVDINNDGHPDVTQSQDTLAELRSVVTGKTRMLVRWIDQLARDPTAPIAAPDREPAVDTIPIVSGIAE